MSQNIPGSALVVQRGQLEGKNIFHEKFCLKGEEGWEDVYLYSDRTDPVEASGLEKFSLASCDTLHLFVVKMTGQTGERTILVKILLNPD